MSEEDKRPEKPRTVTDETSYEVRGNTPTRDTTIRSESNTPVPKQNK